MRSRCEWKHGSARYAMNGVDWENVSVCIYRSIYGFCTLFLQSVFSRFLMLWILYIFGFICKTYLLCLSSICWPVRAINLQIEADQSVRSQAMAGIRQGDTEGLDLWEAKSLVHLLCLLSVSQSSISGLPVNVLKHQSSAPSRCEDSLRDQSKWDSISNKPKVWILGVAYKILRENHHASVVWNWYHWVAIAYLYQPSP